MPNLAQLHIIVQQDVRGNSSEHEQEWLGKRNIATLWLTELVSFIKDLEDQIATRRAALAPLKPPSGHNASPEYLQAKKEFDEWRGRTLHMIKLAKQRKEDAMAAIRLRRGDMPRKMAAVILAEILAMTEQNHGNAEDILERIGNYANKTLEEWNDEAQSGAHHKLSA